MRALVVVEDPADWPSDMEGVEVVRAQDYLTSPDLASGRGVRVVNLCRSYRYQSRGYYVSLLAAARGHRPFPDLMAILDMRNRTLVRTADDELDALVQKSLAPLKGSRFALSIYFGNNLAQRYGRLARRLFDLFPAPLLRVHFTRGENRWRVQSIAPIPARDVPEEHREFVHQELRRYLVRPRKRRSRARFDLAILHDPDEELCPSDPAALERFTKAFEKAGFNVQMVTHEHYGRLGEFDALFIRETTWVTKHTFRWAQRAASLGLVVIDDPRSILRSTNKVYLHEALTRAKVPVPRTWVFDRVDVEEIRSQVGLPCVLKRPDGAFSQGVVCVRTPEDLLREGEAMLEDSDLLIAQEFLPTEYDWRIGVLAGEAIYAARYHMAKGHWQIVQKVAEKNYRYGNVEAVKLSDVPPRVIEVALRAASEVGDGLYGVDLKQVANRVVVMEVNDNPNVDAGCEDAELGMELYHRVARVFLERVEARLRSS